MSSEDWATVASLATAGGTLVLAIATFAAVRSANRSARATERALLAGIRPVLVPSRLEDPQQKVGFADDHWVRVDGGRAMVEVADDAIYFVMSLRNVGNGLAMLEGWNFRAVRLRDNVDRPDPSAFRRLTRDIFVPAGDVGFWQGAFRDPQEPIFAEARDAIEARQPLVVDVLYGDHEGGQRTISRFSLRPTESGQWLATVGLHWNVDRADPRHPA